MAPLHTILFFGFLTQVCSEKIWLIGANSTIMSCEWYGSADSIPIMTDQDRKTLSNLEVESKQALGKSNSCPNENIPKYLVCDTGLTQTGILVTSLGYPFLMLSESEFTSEYSTGDYVSYPCLEPGTFKDKLDNWATDSTKVFQLLFSSDFEKQVKFSNLAVICLIILFLALIICSIVWGLLLFRRICGFKTDCFKPVRTPYPPVRQQQHHHAPMVPMYPIPRNDIIRPFPDSDEETIYALPTDV
ncbi:hypothetical protein [Salmon gill poxvirus]